MSVPNLRAKCSHTIFKQCVVYIEKKKKNWWAQLHRVKPGAVKDLQKIGVAVHNSFYCRPQKELLIFLLNLKIIAVCGVFVSLLEMRMHSSSPLKVRAKMSIQLRITTEITIGGKYQPTVN